MNLQTATRSELEADRATTNARLAQVEAEITSIRADLAARLQDVQSEAQRLRTSLGQIDAELARREANDKLVPTVSDHALLRYMERVHGIDVDAMKADILKPSMITAIKAGAQSVRSPEGTWIIKGSTVVTFKSPDMDKPKRGKRGLGKQHDFDDDEEAA